MSVAICTPLSRYFDWRTVASYMGFVNDARGQCEIMVTGNHERFKPITEARNELVERFLRSEHEWLLWFDSDGTAVYGTLKRLLSWDVPIVSALCFKRREIVSPAFQLEKPDPEVFIAYRTPAVDKTFEWMSQYGQLQTFEAVLLPSAPEGSLIEVDRCGTHCLLVHRSVLEAIPAPRFVRTTPPDSGATGSDYYFCKQAHKAGFKVHVDMSVISGHLNGSHILSGMDFMISTVYMNHQRHNFEVEREKWHKQQK